MTDFKNLTPKQIELLAIKNREASRSQTNEEKEKRGGKKTKVKRTVYVDRTTDPTFDGIDHRSLFKEMKKKPFEE
jgi:hypothetical protein